MFVPVPFTLSFDPNPGAVDQERQGIVPVPIRNIGRQEFLPTAQHAEIRNKPVQADQAQKAFRKPCRLSQSETKKDF